MGTSTDERQAVRTRPIAMIGRRFGRLVVTARAGSQGTKPTWSVTCDCGAERVVAGDNLRTGRQVSCGCASREAFIARNTTHGGAKASGSEPEYRIWHTMRGRCENPRDKGFADYGARGIKVCDRWRDYAAFRADMGRRPSAEHSLDRIDNDGPYSPENCRWATRREQARNRRSTSLVTAGGETRCVTDWANAIGVKPFTITRRLRAGWSPLLAVSTPSRRRGTNV